MQELTKERFVNDFFSLKGNHELEKLHKLKDEYLQNPDLEIWSDPKVATALKILDTWVI
ncbi:MAG: hypothetical protein FWE44_06630 [Defluviitaleaceae bacterium]|nr:hypothetical protein [Defluviitaleaceae bacterium]